MEEGKKCGRKSPAGQFSSLGGGGGGHLSNDFMGLEREREKERGGSASGKLARSSVTHTQLAFLM